MHSLYKHEFALLFLFFLILFFIKNFSVSVISLYKGLVELLPEPPTQKNFLASLSYIVYEKLLDVL